MPVSEDEPKLSEIQQQAIDWLVMLRADSLDDAEMYAFADWLSSDFRHLEAFAVAETLLNDMMIAASSRVAEAFEFKASDRSPIVPVKIKPVSPSRRWFAVSLAMAASVLFAMILLMPQQSPLLTAFLSDYHTGIGEFREIELSDGSRMLLNTNSAVSVHFDDDFRQVKLHHGQVRFTVASDRLRPFEVNIDDLNVRALGTVFEVSGLNADETSLVVQEHAVSARLQHSGSLADTVKVQQGQRLRHWHGMALQPPEPVGLEQATAWQHRQLVVNNRPMSELVAELNRYRNGRIFVSGAELQSLRVSGVFSLDHPDNILSTLQSVFGLKQTRITDWWVVLHR